jgi:hypothetical protein
VCSSDLGGYLFVEVVITRNIFWDVNFFSAVVKAMAAGVSPYNNKYISEIPGLVGYSSGFVYPPFVADVFYTFRWLFLTRDGLFVLLLIHVASWISIPYLLAGSPKKWYARNFLYVWGLYLVLFGLGGMRLLIVGNTAAILMALIIFSIVVAVRTKNYMLFWPTILVCSFVKFYLLSFLLVPVILDKRYIGASGIICVLAALHALNYIIDPVRFSEYIAQIGEQSSDLSNIGLSFYSLATEIISVALGPTNHRLAVALVAIGFHLLFSLAIFVIAYASAGLRSRPERFDPFCCWLFMSAFLISPRIFDYDLAVIIVPFVILGQVLLKERGPGLATAVVVAIFGSILLRTPSSFETDLSKWGAMFAILGVWIGMAVNWLTVKSVEEKQHLSSCQQLSG